MTRLLFGVLAGLVFGIIDVLIMIPMPEKNRRKKIEAMTAAFLERFMIGFLIPNVNLPSSFIVSGLLVGLGLSLPTAIITRAYIPIITIGIIGGLVIGLVSSMVLQ